MAYQTALATALRDWGLRVVEVNGWQTRGSSSFNPGGSVNHHTAGSRYNSLPSLNILVNGRSDLPGPLCNVAQSRSTEYYPSQEYDDVYLIAAGRANHAGSGGWQGLVGNSSVFGLEIEHTGNLSTEPWPEKRALTAYRIHRAFMEVSGFSANMVCQHKEWAPSRKIDFINANGPDFRNKVNATTKTTQPNEPTSQNEEDDNIMNEPYTLVKGDAQAQWFITDGVTKQAINSRPHAAILILNFGAGAQTKPTSMAQSELDKIAPYTWPQSAVDSIRLVS